MTPSIVVESANMHLTTKEFYELKEWNFSRIPVYDNNKDYIVGYVLKDVVLKSVSDDEFQTRLSELMRPILSFNEDESIYQIWEKMLEKREHISIIVDEYGCLRGETKFACVDGPDFDGHQVDFDEAMRRQRMYNTQEKEAAEHHVCRIGRGK